MLKAGKGTNLPEALVSYRLHDKNASRVNRKAYFRKGTKLAHQWVKELFPELPFAEEQVEMLRKVFSGARCGNASVSISEIKEATTLYTELRDCFGEKFGELMQESSSAEPPVPFFK